MTRPQDSAMIVQRFLAAMEARDIDTARSLLAPGFTMTFPGTGPMTSLEQVMEWASPRYEYVRKTFEGVDAVPGLGGTATVYSRGTLSGKWPDGAPFDGIRFIDRFELVADQITRQDVWNDIAETQNADPKASS